MKIILLINSLGTGGAEFSTLTFYGWLKNSYETDVKIVCFKKLETQYDPSNFGIANIIYIRENSFLKRLNCFNQIVKKYNPDIVHSVLFEANLLGRFSRIFKGGFKHLESLVNQTYSPYRLNDPNVNKFKLEIYRILDMITQKYGVDHFHSNGKTVAEHYQEKLHIKKDRITNIPRGRNKNQFLGCKIEDSEIIEGINLKDKVILINVARHEFQKAQDILLDALNIITELKGEYLLLLVGRSGETTSNIIYKIKKYQLEDNVIVLGYRDDVVKLLAASDIFVFPSRFEGLPGALIEAEAAGLPIICSDIPNNLEVVEENNNAMIFPVDNSIVLAKNIKRLVLDANLRKSMGGVSLDLFQEKFNIENVHKKMHSLLKSLM